MNTKRPQPGQTVEILASYASRVPTTPYIGYVVPVVEPGEFEEDDEITVLLDGDEHYFPVACVRVVEA